MATEKKPKAFFTLNLPRKPKENDSIRVQAKLRKNPKESIHGSIQSSFFRFSLIFGIRATTDRNSSIEPSMVALKFKTEFLENDIKVTTNWKTDTGWQNEEAVDSDWIDSKGRVSLTILFEKSSVLITDRGNNLILRYMLKYERDRINRLQLWGNVQEMHEVNLKYNRGSKLRKSSGKAS